MNRGALVDGHRVCVRGSPAVPFKRKFLLGKQAVHAYQERRALPLLFR